MDGQRIRLRDQCGVTLADVFEHFGPTQTYGTLHDEWMKGKLLLRARPTRGARGSGSSGGK